MNASMPSLAVRSLCVQLGGRVALHDVSLSIGPGRWVAVAGPNGAGKTTLLRALAQLLPAGAVVSGSIDLLGRPLQAWPRRERARTLAWFCASEAAAGLPVADIVMLGRLPHRPWLGVPSEQDEAAVERALRQTGCWDMRARTLDALSAGERQRVLLARALAVEAEVLLLDEPLQALDVPHQADWVAIVRGLVSQGRTVVSVLHELSVALAADELVLVRAGRLAWHGDVAAPGTHRALAAVFDERVEVHAVAGRHVVVPR